jgi:ligand-binding SRPBCC domain-containing protein
MRIYLKTLINNDLNSIEKKFNQTLFEKLCPPLVELKVNRFDGCQKNDEIHLEMKLFGSIKQNWVSKITCSYKSNDEFYFIDEGVQLPAPLSQWKHIHRVEKISNKSCYLIDDINFTSGNKLLDVVLYPALYSIFSFRAPIYKRELN